ncbi:MAG: hypothetical protein RDV48_29980 [Candidatus Eremiobacteraeota bacterium]|nr:hypothetical protein [Candidatus Eremiobacteraeota bacterium]
MLEGSDHDDGYEGIDESLREEVDRRVKKVLAREKQEKNRLMKIARSAEFKEEKIRKMQEHMKNRIARIIQWAKEQSS